jgi:hypothetical protein
MRNSGSSRQFNFELGSRLHNTGFVPSSKKAPDPGSATLSTRVYNIHVHLCYVDKCIYIIHYTVKKLGR